jgi:PilZ domain
MTVNFLHSFPQLPPVLICDFPAASIRVRVRAKVGRSETDPVDPGMVNRMSTDLQRREHFVEHFVERRGAQRFEVHLPLAVHFEERTVPGFTQDLSGRGIFFYADATLPEGAVVELTFTMPSEITLVENMPVRCRGRVLRASASSVGQQNGVAVQLDSYQYLPSDAPGSPFVRVSAAGVAGAVSG